MKRTLKTTAAALLITVIAWSPMLLPGTIGLSSKAEARVGARPPEFTLPAIPGGPVSGDFEMEDHLGTNPIVLIFWATWCEPCKQQMPIYERLYQRYSERGLQVVAISMDGPETVSRTGAIVNRLGLTYPVVSDVDTAVSSRLNPRRAAPFTIFIDRRGRIVHEREGFTLAERDDIARAVAALVRTRASEDD